MLEGSNKIMNMIKGGIEQVKGERAVLNKTRGRGWE
jgi:hypothetical protein